MSLFRHLRAWFRRGRLEDELREELAQHVQWKTDGLVADGLPEPEARRRAALEMGNVARLQEESREIWGFPRLDSVVQDVRYGFRQMRRAPTFTTVAVLSLAIGIGASAAVFSLADTMVLQRLPVRNPEQLVVFKWRSGQAMPFSSLDGNGEQNAQGLASTSFSRAALEEMRHAVEGRMDVLGFADLYDVNITAGGQAEIGSAHAVSGNYFGVLGVEPAAGRLLIAADDNDDAPPAVVISDAFWRRKFGRSDVVGRPLGINGLVFTIAGVTPAGFRGIGQVGDAPDLFIPLSGRERIVRDDARDDDPNYWWVLPVGRLRDGITAAQVVPTLDAVLKRTVAAAKPSLSPGDLPRVELLDGSRGQHETRDSVRDPLKTMALVVGIVLLVACANVANLLLARGHARGRELSVRTALGAGRGRVVRQLFTEGALLAALGGAGGLAAARWISAALLPALTASPALTPPGVDWRLAAFVTGLAAACAVFFALTPAIRATAASLGAGLRDAGARGTGGRRGHLAGALVVVQLTLSMVLVVTAALLARSLWNLDRAELGFDPSQVLMFKIDPTLNGYEPGRVRNLAAGILDRVKALPGVAGATFTSHRLLANQSAIGVASTESETPPEPGSADARAYFQRHSAWRQIVGPDFFATLRIPLTRGRALDERDAATSGKTVVINQALAERLFNTDDAVGRRVRLGLDRTSPLYEVVGIAANARYTSVRDDMPPTAYLPAGQHPMNVMTFEVRTHGDPLALAGAVRDAVRGVDDQVPLVGFRTLSDQVAESLRQERLFSRLSLLLGAVALALAAIGLYGLLAYSVALRVPEIGLRMALGAERRSVAWLVLRRSLTLAAVGLAAGGAAALAGTTFIASLLYQLPARDPWTMALAATVMLGTCLIAAYVPARRATRVDPLVALRAE